MPALRLPGPGLSVRWNPRATAVGLVLAAAVLVVGVWTLTTGDFHIPVPDVLAVLTGGGAPGDEYVVNELRLPRLLTALLVGAAMGMSGALFQTLARNPLGSPDVIGFTVGSATGALVTILVIGAGTASVAAGSVAGCALTSVVVYLLAWRGGAAGYRLVLVGIGISALLSSANAYLIARASFTDAQSAQVWLTGSLNGRGWEHVTTMAVCLAVLAPAALVLGRPLRMLEMGEDAAAALGVGVERTRGGALAVGVALTALSTAVAGPVPFVSLVAPQVVRRLTRATGPNLAASAVMGALLLALSDIAAQRALAPTQLPVGVFTGVVGGCYLVWVLARQWRSGRG
ncbi:iron chelate uptake ABC transporter family permease subunit [Streptomyces sp. AV19]|nr:iron chelate uptake ABC transporter family permease subunit [Streptomyces sp. AV19]MBH1933297.1 iron chelate uptake ABC transporter family permease subunit [Streptomyces sp. AV19]MDG4536188.1 iron chelate uptake ABC transporter family permease subunit [Streptomyces sp. AV19]